tara:strand:- start:358 stop:693 length:336 start_codon:yes stop_codon:yes gene_type:complete
MPISIENNSWDYVQGLIEKEINSAFKLRIKDNDKDMIELTYIEDHEELGQVVEGTPIKKFFRSWSQVDKFVKKQNINKYKVQGQSKGGNLIQYTSVLWEDFMASQGWERIR